MDAIRVFQNKEKLIPARMVSQLFLDIENVAPYQFAAVMAILDFNKPHLPDHFVVYMNSTIKRYRKALRDVGFLSLLSRLKTKRAKEAYDRFCLAVTWNKIHEAFVFTCGVDIDPEELRFFEFMRKMATGPSNERPGNEANAPMAEREEGESQELFQIQMAIEEIIEKILIELNNVTQWKDRANDLKSNLDMVSAAIFAQQGISVLMDLGLLRYSQLTDAIPNLLGIPALEDSQRNQAETLALP